MKLIKKTYMRKKLLLLLLLISIMSYSQKTCGYDVHQTELERTSPEIRKAREEAEAKLLAMDVKAYLKKFGASYRNSTYTGPIYEIPVVVHVIESLDASNAGLHLTEAQIQTWINNANKMYATTYGNGFFPEGPGSLDGNVIPFKLTLAKRTPQCTATNGIVRYNGSTIAGYDANGVNRNTTSGASIAQIRTLAPHWAENAYFNIYIVLGFDGDKGTAGLMGWCSFPSNPDSDYDSFMRVAVVTNTNDTTLAHEFGHGIGLDHVFEGASSSPGNNPTASDCPPNANCTTDNDKVCDTSPSASLLSVYPTPTNAAINPCTGTNYDGVQYNVMNYTDEGYKFTAGQRDRGTAMFMLYRSNLTTSNGAKDISTNPAPNALSAATCSPAGITNSENYNAGPTNVTVGNINNSSSGYLVSNAQYYVDYSSQNCINPKVYTDLQANTLQTLKVSFATNPQTIKAWIDYNNNGIFEASELIANSVSSVPLASSPYTVTFTPPATAVLNTYLRMRVRSDIGSYDSCQNLAYGQIEDYSVRITDGTLGTNDNISENTNTVVYTKEANKLTLVGNQKEGFGAYIIYDVNGKVIQKGNTKSNEITINKSITSGMYILSYKNGTETKKFIK